MCNVQFQNWIRRMLINILRFWSRTKCEVVKNKIKFMEFLVKNALRLVVQQTGANLIFFSSMRSFHICSFSKEAMWKLVPFSKSFCFMKFWRSCTYSTKKFFSIFTIYIFWVCDIMFLIDISITQQNWKNAVVNTKLDSVKQFLSCQKLLRNFWFNLHYKETRCPISLLISTSQR